MLGYALAAAAGALLFGGRHTETTEHHYHEPKPEPKPLPPRVSFPSPGRGARNMDEVLLMVENIIRFNGFEDYLIVWYDPDQSCLAVSYNCPGIKYGDRLASIRPVGVMLHRSYFAQEAEIEVAIFGAPMWTFGRQNWQGSAYNDCNNGYCESVHGEKSGRKVLDVVA